MEIKYYGGNCIKIITKHRTVVIDDNLSELGLKAATSASDSLFYTAKAVEPQTPPTAVFMNDSPGEFGLGNLMIQGYSVRAINDESGARSAILYTFSLDRMMVVVAGHIDPGVESDLLESIGVVDALIIPVGGNGYTLDALGAEKITNKLNPRFVIPTHYQDPAVSYPMEQDSVTKFVEEMKLEVETLDSLKLKPANPMDPVQMHLVELNRQ